VSAWVVGLPMIGALGHSSADATYLARILLVFIFAVSSVVVVVGPKIVKAVIMRKNPNFLKTKSRVRVSGVYQQNSSMMISMQSIASCQMHSSDFSVALSRESQAASQMQN